MKSLLWYPEKDSLEKFLFFLRLKKKMNIKIIRKVFQLLKCVYNRKAIIVHKIDKGSYFGTFSVVVRLSYWDFTLGFDGLNICLLLLSPKTPLQDEKQIDLRQLTQCSGES